MTIGHNSPYFGMSNVNFRKIDIDALEEDAFSLEELEQQEIGELRPRHEVEALVQNRAQEVRSLLQRGNIGAALAKSLEDPPYGRDFEAAKERNTQTVMDVLNSTKLSDVPQLVKELVPADQDVLMKYLYKGMASPEQYNSGVLLAWFEKHQVPAGMQFTPEERTFTLHNGIIIAAKYWRNSANGQSGAQRRFLALHGFLDNAASFDLTASTKREAFFPSIEAAARARMERGENRIEQDAAVIIVKRSVKPVEKRSEETGEVIRGYTWRWDRMVKIFDILLDSETYSRAFMCRLRCPILALVSTNAYLPKYEELIETRKAQLDACPSVTVRAVVGNHHFHLEDAPMTAREVTEWICAQDGHDKARL
ncbi:hypothetical protein BGW41_001694 [Actinomortierella wolfii]|nr:hypothetical protein BGW41_001694 [Actinomortierella wolfii]